MSKEMIALFIVASFSCPALAQSTAGWETVTDTRKICEANSPQSWEHTSLRPMDNTPGICPGSGPGTPRRLAPPVRLCQDLGRDGHPRI